MSLSVRVPNYARSEFGSRCSANMMIQSGRRVGRVAYSVQRSMVQWIRMETTHATFPIHQFVGYQDERGNIRCDKKCAVAKIADCSSPALLSQ
jgi:hypothetical protein